MANLTGSQLLSIKVMRIKGFGAPGVMSLVDFTSLQDVDLTFCTKVRNAEVIAIRELKHLQKLKLSACWNITDVGLSALSSFKRGYEWG
jgi:F-box/leucine-rich repeat protein 2/20